MCVTSSGLHLADVTSTVKPIRYGYWQLAPRDADHNVPTDMFKKREISRHCDDGTIHSVSREASAVSVIVVTIKEGTASG